MELELWMVPMRGVHYSQTKFLQECSGKRNSARLSALASGPKRKWDYCILGIPKAQLPYIPCMCNHHPPEKLTMKQHGKAYNTILYADYYVLFTVEQKRSVARNNTDGAVNWPFCLLHDSTAPVSSSAFARNLQSHKCRHSAPVPGLTCVHWMQSARARALAGSPCRRQETFDNKHFPIRANVHTDSPKSLSQDATLFTKEHGKCLSCHGAPMDRLFHSSTRNSEPADKKAPN